MFDFSHFYHRFPEELNNGRIDVLYRDKIYDAIVERIRQSPFNFYPLYELVDIVKESRNPQENPDEEFFYVDIGSIDTLIGVANPERLLGSQATSSRVRRVIKKGNVLVSTTRPTRNAICIVPEELDNQICSTGLAVLSCKPDVDERFLFYALRSEITRLQLERLCSGSGYPAINQETDLPQILVPKPNLTQQRAIINEVQPIAEEAKHLRCEAEQICKAANNILLEELGINVSVIDTLNYFFKTGAESNSLCFSVFPNELSDRLHYLYYHPRHSILNILSSKYQTVTLDNICKIPIARGEQPQYDSEGDYMVIKTVDLKNEYIDYENTLRVTEECFQKHSSARIHKGDILIASTGISSMGKVDIYDRDEPAFADSHITILRVNSDYNPYFIAYFLRSHLGQIQIEKLFTGASGQIELQPTDFYKIIVPVNNEYGVKLTEQNRIANLIKNELSRAYNIMLQSKAKMEEANSKYEELIFTK